jgi:CRP-like cAMP-binding protein
MGMLIETQHSSTVVARSPIRALRLTRSEMLAQMAEDPDLADHFVQMIAGRLTAMAEELRGIDRSLGNDMDDSARVERRVPPAPEVVAQLH